MINQIILKKYGLNPRALSSTLRSYEDVSSLSFTSRSSFVKSFGLMSTFEYDTAVKDEVLEY